MDLRAIRFFRRKVYLLIIITLILTSITVIAVDYYVGQNTISAYVRYVLDVIRSVNDVDVFIKYFLNVFTSSATASNNVRYYGFIYVNNVLIASFPEYPQETTTTTTTTTTETATTTTGPGGGIPPPPPSGDEVVPPALAAETKTDYLEKVRVFITEKGGVIFFITLMALGSLLILTGKKRKRGRKK